MKFHEAFFQIHDEISRSEESLWRLNSIILTSHKIVYFTSRGDNSNNSDKLCQEINFVLILICIS